MFITLILNNLLKFPDSLIRSKHFVHFYEGLSECLTIISIKKMRIFFQLFGKFFSDKNSDFATSVTIKDCEKTELRIMIIIDHSDMSILHVFSPAYELNIELPLIDERPKVIPLFDLSILCFRRFALGSFLQLHCPMVLKCL